MTAAIFGLLGTAVGAVVVLIGGALSDRRQMRQEANRWRRDQVVAAHDGALRHLNRAAKHSHKPGVMARDSQTDLFFDELIEGQLWLHTAISRSPAAHNSLRGAADELDQQITALISGRIRLHELEPALLTAIDRVLDSYRTYMSRSEPGVSE